MSKRIDDMMSALKAQSARIDDMMADPMNGALPMSESCRAAFVEYACELWGKYDWSNGKPVFIAEHILGYEATVRQAEKERDAYKRAVNAFLRGQSPAYVAGAHRKLDQFATKLSEPAPWNIETAEALEALPECPE